MPALGASFPDVRAALDARYGRIEPVGERGSSSSRPSSPFFSTG